MHSEESKTKRAPQTNAVPRRSSARDRTAIADAIARAFFDDPVSIYLFPDETTRHEGYVRITEIAMDQFAGGGATYVNDPVQGAAIWQAPSPKPPGFLAQVSMSLRLLRTMGRGITRGIRLAQAMEANHYRKPHWYLAILGVEPEAQGRGLGSVLMKPILDHCDAEGMDAYLESSKAANIPFYQRHGFEVTGEIQIPDGPTLWPMLRKPALDESS